MHAVQRLYGTARPTEIAYEVAGRFVPAGVALVAGERGRQRIRYDSGLTLWVNWLPEPWKVEGRILPQWGFLALGPGTEVCTVLRDGKLADMADCPDYLFVDARTSFEMPYLKPGKEIEPRLREFKHLGENRVRLTYEWVVNDTLADDYHCFVHFTNEASKGPDKIEFQQDHGLPKPTSQWRKGETIVDGPYEIAIPAGRDTYDLTIGLHKGARVPLKGIQAGGSRILLGRLVVKRAGDKVTEIALGDIGEAAREQEVGRADFGAHLNPAGTWVEFGKVGTDGSAKINKEKGRLVIFPYPRGKEFRLSLSLKALAPAADPARVQVRAVAAGTGQDLGKAVFTVAAGRLTLTTGTPGAGRYVVTW